MEAAPHPQTYKERFYGLNKPEMQRPPPQEKNAPKYFRHQPGFMCSISYENLKSKGIYVFSYMNGKTYALSKVKPLPSYLWRRLEYLPENIKAYQINVTTTKKEYKIVVAR